MTDADLDALVARLSEHQTFALPADTPDKTQAIIEQMCFDGAEAADALTELRRERDEWKRKHAEVLPAEHALSDSYVALREIVGALKEPFLGSASELYAFTEQCAVNLKLRAERAEAGREWQPIKTAPRDGMPETILLWVPTLHGTGGPVLAHWAHGGGDDQPRFGPAWFFWTGFHFQELREKPTHWMPLPPEPKNG